jgi:23S rRNA (cytidine1920-2'-O)/16S rRNA (cytidine1409-2'-O)-methyltransferase
MTHPADSEESFASRGGLKLDSALRAFGLDVTGRVAADLGASTGGFVDVLLRRGAKRVYAVEKGFGVLEWRLRQDPRVVLMERTDATQLSLPEPIGIVTIDIGFTRQAQVLPVALKLLSEAGVVVSLLKPQYEASGRDLEKGKLTPTVIERVMQRTIDDLRTKGITVSDVFASSVRGRDANVQEYFLLLHQISNVRTCK